MICGVVEPASFFALTRFLAPSSTVSLADLYGVSHAFVSASRVETFGTALVEAQACGLPAVATRTSGSAYVMQSNDQGFLVEMENPETMMMAMMELMEKYERFNPETISTLMYTKFREEGVIEQWKEIYSEVTT